MVCEGPDGFFRIRSPQPIRPYTRQVANAFFIEPRQRVRRVYYNLILETGSYEYTGNPSCIIEDVCLHKITHQCRDNIIVVKGILYKGKKKQTTKLLQYYDKDNNGIRRRKAKAPKTEALAAIR